MYLRRSASVKYLLAAFVGAAIYCEWFMYRLQPYFWQELKCPDTEFTCTKILFIADPQIQGVKAVPPPLSTLFNWDSDRFLSSTFSVVLNHFKPDVLVYLGDLMDEGSISTKKQFHKYVLRLSNIFQVDYPVVQVWLPGDNDIGGENEPIRKDVLAEFETVFDQPPEITYRNITFYEVNGITRTYPKNNEVMHNGLDSENFRIVVSHYPVTSKGVFAQQVNKDIRPDVYFCAHEHESKYVRQNRELKKRWTEVLTKQVLEISSSDESIYEIFVPTCSYRMGTSSIGYGAAVVDDKKMRMRYTVFWSPTRFPYLFFYLLLLVILNVYVIIFCTAKLFFKNNNYKMANDKVPLLDRV